MDQRSVPIGQRWNRLLHRHKTLLSVVVVLLAIPLSFLLMLLFFQWLYPLLLRSSVESMVVDLYGPEQARSGNVYVEGIMFLTSTLMSLAGTITLTAVAYLVVTRSQEKSAKMTLDIERLRLLRELEAEAEEIHAETAVIVRGVDGFLNDTWYSFNVALTGAFKWHFAETGRRTSFEDGQRRMEMFTKDSESLVASASLHRVLHWFRRLDRGRDLALVTDLDLYLLWRYVLCLATDGRFEFLDRYFCGRGQSGSEDLEALRRTLVHLIRYVLRTRKQAAIDYLNGRVDERVLYDPELIHYPDRSLLIRDA